LRRKVVGSAVVHVARGTSICLARWRFGAIRFGLRVDDFAAINRAVAEGPMLFRQRSKTSWSFHGGNEPARRRAALLVVFVILTFLSATAVKLARASSHETHTILCDGIDDDTAASVLCTLPEDTTKKSSSAKVGPYPRRKAVCSAVVRPRPALAGSRGLISPPDSPRRAKRLLTLRAGSSDDPGSPH
jgi:hypothetical protein